MIRAHKPSTNKTYANGPHGWCAKQKGNVQYVQGDGGKLLVGSIMPQGAKLLGTMPYPQAISTKIAGA